MPVKSKAGFIEAASWGAAYAQPTTLLPLKSESFSTTYDRLQDMALVGRSSAAESFNGHVNVGGDIQWYLDYDNHAFLKYAFGAVSAGVYTHDEQTACANVEVDKVLHRMRLNCMRLGNLTIAGDVSSSEPITCSSQGIVRSASRSATAFPALTETPNRAWFKDIGIFYIGDLADALGGGDALAIKSFEIGVDNAFKADSKDSSSLYVLDPVWDGFAKFTLKLGVARINTTNADQLPVWKEADTRLQGLLTLNGTGGAFSFVFPQMKIVEGADFSVGGPGVIEGDVTLECYANTANSVMSTVTSPIHLTAT